VRLAARAQTMSIKRARECVKADPSHQCVARVQDPLSSKIAGTKPGPEVFGRGLPRSAAGARLLPAIAGQ
jgi:hypothetical protein